MRERLFVSLSTVVMKIISKSFEVSARKVTQTRYDLIVKINLSWLDRLLPSRI